MSVLNSVRGMFNGSLKAYRLRRERQDWNETVTAPVLRLILYLWTRVGICW